MEPTRDDDAVVDLVDVLLREGTVLAADVVISVADVPLIGLRLRLLLAGMTTIEEELPGFEHARSSTAMAGDSTAGGGSE